MIGRQNANTRIPQRCFALLISLVLVVLGGPANAWAWGLPQPGSAAQSRLSNPGPLPTTAPAGRLQEAAPPAAVQQLQQALSAYHPQLEISGPRSGTVLPAGPWQLNLQLQDWPLVDAGTLGLGPHLVVQIDDQPPLRIAGSHDDITVLPLDNPNDHRITLSLPALSPGSHRITAYAARPWGEAVKSPGALRQIQVHRVAANPVSLPAIGTPQLLPVSPSGSTQVEPVLLDWLLLDAPLQNLRPGDGSWRLRVTINGDSFLVDQNVPMWLRGWRQAGNSLLLELVDGLGEPLNPPFNSVVLEVDLTAASTRKPRWLQGPLDATELAILLGQAAAPVNEPEQNDTSSPEPSPEPSLEPSVAEASASPSPSAPDQQQPEATADDSATVIDADAQIEASAEIQADIEMAKETEIETEAEITPDKPLNPARSQPERISSSTPLVGSAREQVNADGSLIKPGPNGPLARLRQLITP